MMKWISVFTLLVAVGVHAEVLTFDFDTEAGQAAKDLDDQESGTTLVTGSTVTVEMSAFAEATNSSGGDVFNITSADEFGINSSGTGDVTTAFDQNTDGTIDDYMVFSFDHPGRIIEFDLGGLTDNGAVGEDRGSIAFGINSTNNTEFHGGTMDNGTSDIWAVDLPFDAGESISLSYLDGNGFYLDSITVDAQSVPEPTALSFLLLAGAALLRRRH